MLGGSVPTKSAKNSRVCLARGLQWFGLRVDGTDQGPGPPGWMVSRDPYVKDIERGASAIYSDTTVI